MLKLVTNVTFSWLNRWCFWTKRNDDERAGESMILVWKCKLCAWKSVNMQWICPLHTPPYALHRPLLPICAPRAGIPSKTDHRVRKLTYTLQPGGREGGLTVQTKEGRKKGYIDDMRILWLLHLCGCLGGASESKWGKWGKLEQGRASVSSRYSSFHQSCFPITLLLHISWHFPQI